MKVVAVFWALVVRVSSTGGQDSRRWSDIPHVLDGAQIETDVTHRVLRRQNNLLLSFVDQKMTCNLGK
jgi:hypothetical protein